MDINFKNINQLHVRFLIWRLKHINNRDFVLLLSGLIGIIAGLSAVILKELVHFIQNLLVEGIIFEEAGFLYLAYPLIGILLTVVVAKYILKDKLGHGITSILFAISKKSSIVARARMYSRVITSAITVGFGGSVGLEAPIVVTGSAIGSNIGRLMHLNYKKRTLLIGCGAAGAVAAIFDSPIAGVLFSIEVILTEVTIASFTPLLIASVAGSLISLMLLGDEILFSVQLTDRFTAGDTPYYLGLGVVCGFISLYFTRANYKVEGMITSIQRTIPRAITGGLALGMIIFLFPPIYGEGYGTIKNLISGNQQQILASSFFFNDSTNIYILIVFLFGVLLIKPVASSLTIGAGGSGGLFAPSLFVGGVTGFLFASVVNVITGQNTVSLSNFTLVGMCGVMSGVLHAPLTAIFLIAEITSGYTLFIPLMLVSAIAYTTISYYEKYSIYTKELVEKGDLIPDDRDRQVLSLISLRKLLETDLLTIHPDQKLKDLVNLVRLSKRNIFPVVNEKKELAGIITLDDIREIMFDEEARQTVSIRRLMHMPPASISTKDTMQDVMNKFETTGAWNLPVIDEGKYIGFVSKSTIFNVYRKKLIRQGRSAVE